MRFLSHLAIAGAVAAVSACSNESGITAPSADALQTADQLTQLADSISASDAATASTIRGLAEVVRQSGAASTVQIAVDGETHEFSAVSNESIFSSPCVSAPSSGDQPVTPCVAVPLRTRSFVAWQPTTHRIVLLTALAESGDIGGAPDATRLTVPAQLQLFDGKGGVWWGVSGSQANSMTLGKECPSITARTADRQVTVICHEADFRWRFSAIAGAPPLAIRGNTASGQHKLEMAESTVHGAQWKFAIVTTTPPPTPPPASPLVAALRVAVDSVVHLAFTVKNATDVSIELKFASAKTHDFAIADRSGETLWRWSAGKEFGDAATVITIPAHEGVTFTEIWHPTAHGELIAGATLTSATQNVSARAAFTVP